jgi:hypothetical protein
MIGDLFDSPWKTLIIALVIIALQQTVAANGRGPGGHRADSLTRGPQEMG